MIAQNEKIYREAPIIGGDKAYADDKLKKYYRSNSVFYGIMIKQRENSSLSGKQKKPNRKLSG